MIKVPTAQENSEQIFFEHPKAHQFKFADLNKMVPTNLLKMIAFFRAVSSDQQGGRHYQEDCQGQEAAKRE
jgi:hypothetical protein